ncbi:hypothetical protein BWQ96_05813 [Gracilariopsis chorda]|uniref:Uncharacterized protein n=1 Tax=Gracilariopsis chorda TaxID=448386 RepID=A0A2V3IQS6_9FLOR|nr:hypothetical protein BWQ96_05813 [Gracilariopsis chorda]|eukprot:PXF44443.1 hypothetical protein BWQ96_05813 [Gracilariopsis chorda]
MDSWHRIPGSRGELVKQIHLHIDDPNLVITQKYEEQTRRDNTGGIYGYKQLNAEEDLRKIGFQLLINAPWSTLISSRNNRDAICSVHLFCGAVAALELSEENGRHVDIYLHGGCFCFDISSVGKSPKTLFPELAITNDIFENLRDGEVVLAPANKKNMSMNGSVRRHHSDFFLQVPRTSVLRLSNRRGLEIPGDSHAHGEAKTRVVAAFATYVKPVKSVNDTTTQGPSTNEAEKCTLTPQKTRCACVIISKDTDVAIILSLAEEMHGYGVLHVIANNFIEIDKLTSTLSVGGITFPSLACLYILAGLGNIEVSSDERSFEMITMLAYVERKGFTRLVTSTEKNSLRIHWLSIGTPENEIRKRAKGMFVRDHVVGSDEWRLEVKNQIADMATTTCQLVPLREHFKLQAQRVKLVVYR